MSKKCFTVKCGRLLFILFIILIAYICLKYNTTKEICLDLFK